MMNESFRKLKLVLLALAVVAGLVGCGVLVDTTPASVSLFTPTGEVPEGFQLVGVRAVDQESGIKSVLVERRDADLWVVVADESFVIDSDSATADSSGPGDELSRSRDVVAELPLGEHDLRVTVVNGSNRDVVVERSWGAPVVYSPVRVQLLPVTELLGDSGQVRASLFTVRFTVSGDHVGEAELWVSLNGGEPSRFKTVDLSAAGDLFEIAVDGGLFNVGDELRLTVRVLGMGDASPVVAELPVMVIAPRLDQVDPESKPLKVNVNVKPSGTVTRSENITVSFSVTGGIDGVESLDLFVAVNDSPEQWLEVTFGGVSPFIGEFTVDAGDYAVGDDLVFRVEAKDVVGQVVSAEGGVRVVAPEEAVADPLEVLITDVTQVNSSGELLSGVPEFEVRFVAESGVPVNRVDLMVSRDGGAMQLLQRQTPGDANVSGSFVVDSSGFDAGSEFVFEVVARDANNRTAKTVPFTVRVVSPPPAAVDPLEVSIGMTPSSVVQGEDLVVPFDVTSGADVTEVALWVGVDGGPATRRQVSAGGGSPVTGVFTLNSGQFSVDAELLVEVRSKDSEGREATASVEVVVIAAPVVTLDPLEVGVTSLVGVSSSNELLSTVSDFQILYLARSGAPVSRVDLRRSRNGGAFQLLDSVTPNNVSATGQFVVNASNFEAGEVYEFRLDATDEAGRMVSSDVVTVTVVDPAPVVLDAVEAFVLRVDPSSSTGEVERGPWMVHYTSSTDASLSVQHVSLLVQVNGGVERMIERASSATGAFSVDGLAYAVGDEVSFVVVAEDDRGESEAARSAPLVVTVVGVPEPVPTTPSVNAAVLQPVVTTGFIDRADVMIRANASSGVDLSMVRLMLSVNGGPAVEVDSDSISGKSGTVTLTAHQSLFDEGDDLEFSVTVSDSLDRTASSSIISVSVRMTPVPPVDDNPPVGESIIVRTVDPSNTFIDREGVLIEFASSDDVGLAWVRLLESINGGVPTAIPFSSVEVSGTYTEGSVPVPTSHYSKGDVVVFTLETVDAAGNTDRLASRPYEVAEFVDSSGYLVSELPESMEIEDDLQLNIALYDDGSTGVSSFDLYLNGTLTPFAVSSDGRVHSYAWDMGVLLPGVHTVVIVVKFEDEAFTPVLIMHTITLETADEEEMPPVGP